MMSKRRSMSFFLAVLIFALLFSGCIETPQQELPLAGKKFAIVVKSEGNKYFEAIISGFRSVVEPQGGVLVVKEPSQATAEEQITIIDELISENVDCIAIASNSKTAVAPALQKAVDYGIKILSFDSAAEPDSRALHVNPVDAQRIAQELMDAAAEIIGGKGQIAIMSTTNQAENQNRWIAEIRKLLETAVYPDLTLVNIVYGEDDYETTYTKTQSLIDTYPDLVFIIAPTAAGIPAVAECVTNNGLNHRLKITGLGMPSQMAKYIGPELVCPRMFLWDLDEVGRLTAYAAIALVNGTINGEIGEALSAGDMGDYYVTQDPFGGTEIVLQAAPICFDAKNIAHWKEVY